MWSRPNKKSNLVWDTVYPVEVKGKNGEGCEGVTLKIDHGLLVG